MISTACTTEDFEQNEQVVQDPQEQIGRRKPPKKKRKTIDKVQKDTLAEVLVNG